MRSVSGSPLAVVLVMAVTLAAAAVRDGRAAGPTGPGWTAADSALGLAMSSVTPPVTGEDLALDISGRTLFTGGDGRLTITEAVASDPRRAPRLIQAIADQALDGALRPAAVLVAAAARQDRAVRLNLLGDPTADAWRRSGEPNALFDAIASFYSGGKRLTGNPRDELRRLVVDVPPTVARLTAYLLYVREQAAEWHARAFSEAEVGRGFFEKRRFEPVAQSWVDSLNGLPAGSARRDVERAATAVDFFALNAGASLLAHAVERATAVLDTMGQPSDFRFVWDSPAGRIALGGAGAQRYLGEHLLILDLGGDDEYVGAGSVRSLQRPVSLVIDRAGNDRYAPADSAGPGPGGALCGYALVADLDGDDQYRSWGIGLGSAAFGVGLLWDRAGRDSYESHAVGQGAALFGVGVLIDAAGDDRYRVIQAGQGFGGPVGVGWLIDAGGNDEYLAPNEPLAFGSAQDPTANTSLAQGCGSGLRADYVDGHSLAGGFGLLADGGGDDRYGCGVFGQGAGFWYGTGALVDRDGRDEYDGVWYAQGSAAHFAAGLLVDDAGDDRFRATRNMAQGAGHDLSIGVLADLSGNDQYESPNLSLGSGNDNGLGLFLDASGDDRYGPAPGALSLGAAGRSPATGVRTVLATRGFFFDLGGADVYPADRSACGNGRAWPAPGGPGRAAGVDR